MKVFVYGILKRGLANDSRAKLVGEAVMEGYALYDVGAFPAAVPDPQYIVRGLVYEIEDDLLINLDRIEGYREEDEEGSFYIRRVVSTDHGDAWMYIYNQRYDHLQLIENGEWKSNNNRVWGVR